jgi:hypothetical protein
MHKFLHTCIKTFTHTYMHTHTHTCPHSYMYTHIHTFHTHICTHIVIYTQPHTYIHTHARAYLAFSNASLSCSSTSECTLLISSLATVVCSVCSMWSVLNVWRVCSMWKEWSSVWSEWSMWSGCSEWACVSESSWVNMVYTAAHTYSLLSIAMLTLWQKRLRCRTHMLTHTHTHSLTHTHTYSPFSFAMLTLWHRRLRCWMRGAVSMSCSVSERCFWRPLKGDQPPERANACMYVCMNKWMNVYVRVCAWIDARMCVCACA